LRPFPRESGPVDLLDTSEKLMSGREEAMADEKIRWGCSVEDARSAARSEGKLVLIDLFSPN
jgi:hypothetical protein